MPRQIITKIIKLKVAHDTNEVQIRNEENKIIFIIVLFYNDGYYVDRLQFFRR